MLEIVSPKDMKKIEEDYINKKNITNRELIYEVALEIYKSYKWYGNILIVCGKGNNASDGYALASILKKNNFNSSLYLCENSFSTDGIYYYNEAINNNINIEANINNIDNYDIIVDCIFGTGFHGTLDPKIANIIDIINNSKKYVISIDINSGLNSLNGLSSNALKADLVLACGIYKYGHFLNMAKDYIKELKLIDLGFKGEFSVKLFDIYKAKEILGKRSNFSNKGDYGYIGIMGGSKNYPGAIKLASLGQSALYSGCGISRIIVPDIISNMLYPYVLESTIYPLPSNGNSFIFKPDMLAKAINRLDVLSIGVGISLDLEVEKILNYLILNFNKRLLIDADGLTILSKMDLNILNKAKCQIVLTPHLKEFSRLTKYSIDEILNDPVGIVKEFVNKYNVTLLLKGPTTIIANKDDMYFSTTGTPGMATAGSGDVLTGILSGVLGYIANILDSVALGAYINGLSGEIAENEYSDISMVSSDTARCVSKAIKRIVNS